MIDQQPHLPGLTIESSHRQIGLAERRPSNRQASTGSDLDELSVPEGHVIRSPVVP